jgi:hypothetical protein
MRSVETAEGTDQARSTELLATVKWSYNSHTRRRLCSGCKAVESLLLRTAATVVPA